MTTKTKKEIEMRARDVIEKLMREQQDVYAHTNGCMRVYTIQKRPPDKSATVGFRYPLQLSKELTELFPKQSADGPFFLGETISLADVAILPMLARVSACVPQYAGGYKYFDEFPRFAKLLAAARELLADSKVLKEPEAYVQAYQASGTLPAL